MDKKGTFMVVVDGEGAWVDGYTSAYNRAMTASIDTEVVTVESVVPRFHWLLPFWGTMILEPPIMSLALALRPNSLMCPLG